QRGNQMRAASLQPSESVIQRFSIARRLSNPSPAAESRKPSKSHAPQESFRRGAVPIHEPQYELLGHLRIRPGRVRNGPHTPLIVLSERPILLVGCGPDFDEPLEVVINTLDGVLVYEPLTRRNRLPGPTRPRLEREGVIADDVIESVRLHSPPHRAHVSIADPSQLASDCGLPIYGVGNNTVAERIAADLIPRGDRL